MLSLKSILLKPAFCNILLTKSFNLVNTPSSNLISPVAIASENNVKTSSALAASLISGSDLYCSILAAKSEFLKSSVLMLLNCVLIALAKAKAFSSPLFIVLNKIAWNTSWPAVVTAFSLTATFLFITIVLPSGSINPLCFPASLAFEELTSVLSLINSSTAASFSNSITSISNPDFLTALTTCSVAATTSTLDLASVSALEISLSLLSISLTLVDSDSVKLGSSTDFILSFKEFFSFKSETTSTSSDFFKSNLFILLAASWVDLKLFLILSPCSWVISAFLIFLSTCSFNILLEFLILDILISDSVIGVLGSKASVMFLYGVFFNWEFILTLSILFFKFKTCFPMDIGALPNPEKASNPISATSIFWPATTLPAYSPVPPPPTSIPAATAAPTTGAPLKPAEAILPPTPLAKPKVANSTAPIVTPLPKALFFNSCNFSGLSNIFLTFSAVKSPSISSCNNSEKVKPVSIAVILPVIAPEIAPGIAPIPAK